jgi:hypothetical protein
LEVWYVFGNLVLSLVFERIFLYLVLEIKPAHRYSPKLQWPHTCVQECTRRGLGVWRTWWCNDPTFHSSCITVHTSLSQLWVCYSHRNQIHRCTRMFAASGVRVELMIQQTCWKNHLVCPPLQLLLCLTSSWSWWNCIICANFSQMGFFARIVLPPATQCRGALCFLRCCKASLTWRYPIKLVVNLSWSCQGALSLGFTVPLSQFSKRWQEDVMAKPKVHNAMICCKKNLHQFIILNIKYFPITHLSNCLVACTSLGLCKEKIFPQAPHCAIEIIPNTSCYTF